MRRTAFLLVSCFLLATPSAESRVRQAESVLPPGQSGFVSPTGVASGTGSEHLYDQQPLFTAFRYKNALLRPSAAGGTETPRPGVTITRDEYGVPSIDGASETDAWFGAGYAVAQDRLFQIELFRRATTGRLAEILGRGFLEDDLVARRDYYTGDELERMFRALPQGLQDRAAAYREGVNAWVRHVRTTPADLPGEYAALATQPVELTEREQAAIGIDQLNRARTVQEADAAIRSFTWNENVMAADSRGQIGFWHPGLHQLRPRGYDERLPYPGTGEAEWRGLRDRARDPHVINPKQGWLSNWNNLPAKGWTSGDAPAQERLGGRYHRGEYLARSVRGLHARGGGYEAAKDLIRTVGVTAQQRPLAIVRLRRAARGASGESGAVLSALLAWSGDYHATDPAGTVDPGVAIWEQFKDSVEARALRRLGARDGAAKELAGETSDSHMFDMTNGEAYGIRASSAAGLRAAAGETFDVLAKRFGTRDVARWREKRRLYDVVSQGAGSAPELPFFDRGTWEQFVKVGP